MTHVSHGYFEAAIPLMEKIEIPGVIKYTVDLTGAVSSSFIQKDGATFLEIQFKVAGVKVPPENPKPIGTPIGRCTIKMEEAFDNGGIILVPEKVQIEGVFDGIQDDRLKTGTFTILIPMQDAVISEQW